MLAGTTADLVVNRIDLPQSGVTGQPLQVTYEIGNAGGRSTEGGWRDLVYLSRDELLDTRTDLFLGYHDHKDLLAAGETREILLAPRLPKGLSGSYYVFVLPDRTSGNQPFGAVFEGGAEDNTMASAQPIVVEPVPPADLILSNATVTGGSSSGEAVTIGWTGENVSDQAVSGNWSDAVYLSRDAEWDIGDIYLGRVEQTGGLAAGATYSAEIVARLPALADGVWRVILRADARDEIAEATGEANNVTLGGTSLNVSAPVLTLGVPGRSPWSPQPNRSSRSPYPSARPCGYRFPKPIRMLETNCS